MLDFFERQAVARRNTFLLFFLFFLAVVVIVGVVHWSVTLFLLFTPRYAMTAPSFGALLRDPGIALVTIPAVLLLIFIGNAYKFFTLRRGGSDIALRLGGRLVMPDSGDPREMRLLNIVEEMALASGLPVPLVYILDQENGINAFAAGFTSSDAVIAVTSGALDLLSRDELQGVIAHEFSHIANGDTRLNLRLIGLVHGILLLHLTGAAILRAFEMRSFSKRRDTGNSAFVIAVGFLLYVLGFIGGLLAKLIKMAISRQREYLSDASAVQFTRNPLGLASALKKIGGLTLGSRLRHPLAEEASHMFFGNGVGDTLFAIFSTHPPLARRIALLDPSFDGTYPKVSRPLHEIPVAVAPGGALSGALRSPQVVADAVAPLAASAEILDDQPGGIDQTLDRYMRQRRAAIRAIPEHVRTACRDASGARAVVLNLLFSDEEQVRAHQWSTIRGLDDHLLIKETERLFPLMRDIAPGAKLPLLDLALPPLRLLDSKHSHHFMAMIQQQVAADKTMDLFEYMLHLVLVRNLERTSAPPPAKTALENGKEPYFVACWVILSVLAKNSSSDELEQKKVLNRSFAHIPEAKSNRPEELIDAERRSLRHFDQALRSVAALERARRNNLLNACLQAISHDGHIEVVEAELFRAIGAGLDCPIPPAMLAC